MTGLYAQRIEATPSYLLRLDLRRLDLLFFRRQKDLFFPLAQLQFDKRLHVVDRFFLQGEPVNRRLR